MRVCLITHRRLLASEREHLQRLAAGVRAGAARIQIREKDLGGAELLRLTRTILATVREQPGGDDVEVLVNGRLDVALAAGADGVHLPASGLPVAGARRLAPPGFIVAVSTHCQDDLAAAVRSGADDAVFGPVFPTASHPGEAGVGVDRLRRACSAALLPVWAIGGVGPGNVRQVAATGVAGVAVIRAAWQAADTEDAVRRLVAA